MKVPAAGEDHKFTVFGALDYASGRVLWQLSPQKNSDEFGHFLEQIAAAFPDEAVIVVLDNVGYHKSHALRDQWQRLSQRMTSYWLPAYAPQLNLIERVWRWLKSKLACHRWWKNMAHLQTATRLYLPLSSPTFILPTVRRSTWSKTFAIPLRGELGNTPHINTAKARCPHDR
jgi:transposase